MRLKTKLVLAATGVTFGVVILLSVLFLGELLREGIAQTVSANNVLADEVRSATRQALEKGLAEDPPADRSAEAFQSSIIDALRGDEALKSLMDSIVRYSLTVQDVSVTDVRGLTLASTDPDAVNQIASFRTSLTRVSSGNVIYQMREVFARTQVFDVAAPLDRNGQPFLVVHVGLRSTFLRATYLPGLSAAGLFSVLAAVALVAAAGLLTNVALRPLETINAQLELLTGGAEEDSLQVRLAPENRSDTVVRVAKTIDRLERTMRSKEAGYTALKTNLDQMLDTLRDGVLLFAADRSSGVLRAVMVSDAVEHFLAPPEGGAAPSEMVGRCVEEIFIPGTALGTAVLASFSREGVVAAEVVTLEDGRQVQIALDRIEDGQGTGIPMGTLLTLRDMGSALELEQELEVSRRLAAIGRITAGVGHEVKNPINAMVLHLELLRGKLAMTGQESEGAQRHVEILTSEMQRLDRVVQTLADFSRPMDMRLKVIDLHDLVASVIDLTWAQMREHKVNVRVESSRDPLMVHVDSDLIRQALLNLMLNAMQAMADGGIVKIALRREQNLAVVEVSDEGTGIPADLLPRIFELYFTTKKTGSGIGLAMTYRILQMHGGALDVRSSADTESKEHGSVFTLRLPISMLSSTMRGDTKSLAGMKDRGERA